MPQLSLALLEEVGQEKHLSEGRGRSSLERG